MRNNIKIYLSFHILLYIHLNIHYLKIFTSKYIFTNKLVYYNDLQKLKICKDK